MLPPFVKPVQRPEFIYQSRIIDFMVKLIELRLPTGKDIGDDLYNTFKQMVHGANYNDPQRFLNRNYNQLKSSLQRESLSFGRYGI
jgi:cyanobactin biosynthesis protein (PatB/AcyB/McaB family)